MCILLGSNLWDPACHLVQSLLQVLFTHLSVTLPIKVKCDCKPWCRGKVNKVCCKIHGNNQLDALFHVFIYFMSLRVSSITALIIRRSNCINTSSSMISLCKWLLSMPVRRELQFPPDRHTKQSLTQTNHTRWCIIQFDLLMMSAVTRKTRRDMK